MDTTGRGKNFAKLALCLFLVPVIGWLTYMYLVNSYERQFRDAVLDDKSMTAEQYLASGTSYRSFCAKRAASTGKDRVTFDKLCSFDDETQYLRYSVWMTGAFGAILLLLIFGARALAGTSRARMAAVFGPLVRTVMALLALSVLAQGALLIYCLYTLEAAAIHRVHTGILGAIGLGVIAVCLTLLRSAFSFFKHDASFERATLLDRSRERGAYDFVSEIAEKLGATKPDHIILGLAPNFYVTAGDVNVPLPDRTLSGRTLYMSLPLLRLFTKSELAAVIGHELGHFRGEDTAYSMRFAPTYARLGGAIGAMASRAGNASDLARVPAMAALTQCWLEFASAERTVGRERELLADKAGADAASARDLATALVKVSLFAPAWQHVQKQNIEVLAEGKMFTDLSTQFAQTCGGLPSEFWEQNRAEIAQNVQPHPVDTHPPLHARLANLGLSVEDISGVALKAPESSAASLLAEADTLGESLTIFEDRYLVAIKAVVIPDKEVTAPS